MNTLSSFRSLAEVLEKREKVQCAVRLMGEAGDVALPAVYDPFFQTISFSGSTVPVKELLKWARAFVPRN